MALFQGLVVALVVFELLLVVVGIMACLETHLPLGG